MAQQDDNIKKLYDELQSTYDVGSEDDFRNYLNNAEHRKALYNELKNDYDIQDEKAFDDYLGYINGEKALGTTKVGSVAQQVVNEYDQSAKDNAEAEEDLSAATSGAKIGGNISFAPAKPNNQQTVQPDVDNTAKSVMDASGTPAEQAKATGPKTQFVPEDPNYVQATPTAEALKKYPWMQPDQVYMWNRTTKEPVVTYVDESGHAVIDEDLQIKKAKSEITGQDDTEYMYPEAAALQLPNGNTTGLKIKKGALTQMADEILRKEYGDNYLNTQFGKDGNVYTGAERRDLGAQQLYDELNSDVRNARISFAVADEKDRNEILSRIKAKWGKVADANSIINAVNDENAAKRDIDIVAQQNINELNAEIQKISQQMDLRGAEIDNASSPFVDQTFNARDVDPKYRILQSKLNYAQNALKSWENVKNSSSLNAFSGFKDAIMDISAWDFGFSDLKNSIALLTAKGNDKQELVNLYGKSSEATKFEDKYNPDSYRYGKIAGASIPFALQFVGTGGGFKSIGSAVSKKATSIAEKYALEGLKKQVVKGLGVVAGDIARAYTMSGTIQGLNTISDILNRSAGELTVDKQGNYQLKSDEPLLKSIYKGVTASAIENYTEMLGERLNIGGNLMRMLPKIGLGRVSNAVTKIGTQDWYRVCNNWLSRAGVNDFGGEVLEEEIGIILNAALVGDNPLFNGSGGLLDVRTQKDILGGMLYSISAMRAGALAMYGVKKGVGSAFIKTLDMYDKMQLNQSDKGGQSIFGEGWAAIKDEIDNTPNEKVNAVIEKLAKEHPSKDEQSAIIDYAVKLLKTRGHNLGIAMASDGENDEGAQEEVQDMPDLSQPNAEYFNKDDGMIHKASLYPDASDPTGTAKDVFIIKGNLVTNEDGSINKDASDDTIIYIDGNGERHIASPDKFAAAYPPMSNDEVQQANEGVTGEGTQTTDTFNKGDEVNINVNGIIYTATIQGTDGSGNYNVYYEDENGMMRPAQFTADQLASMNSASTASNDKQNMIEQLAGNQQQIEQSAEEQVAQQEQPAQEEQKPAIPTDEKGNMLYHQVPVETTINDLYDGSLDDNEIRDFVDANISEADKNLEKVNKKAPKIGTNKDEYLKKKQEWQKQVEDATRIRDYWNSVKNYIAQQTHTTPEEIKVAQDELSGEAARREYQDMGGSVQQDAVSVASDFIRGAKITPESFKAETGYGTDEQRKFVGMIAKAENGGKTIDRLAEELVSYDNAEMNGVLFGGDTSSAKDAILSALQGAGTRGELKQTNEAEEQAYIDARNAARDEQYMEQYGMTYEEYLVYEEQIMPTIWREYNNYDEVAFNNMYAEEIEQLIKSIENDTTGEEQADDRGNQVLPEQQVTEQRGSTGSQEQRTEAPVGVQGNNENAVAPEEASGERIPNIERGRQGYTGYIARRQQNNLETSEEINVPLSQNEQDEYGNPMVLAENGSTVFGTIESESGLTEAPIKLSLGENKVGTDGKNHGYGLLHIEAGHGEQIRNAGYQSVEQFVENVAQNYTDIKEGALIGKKQTYLLEVSDEHNNTLFIQLSNDGTYWNVNSAGIFKKKYSRRKPLIYTVPAVGKSTVTDTSEVNSGQSMGATAPAGNSSESKDSDKSAFAQTIDEKIAKAEEETDVNPTEGQKEAGNYKKGHVCIDGYDITIEQPKGSVRRGTDADGKQWEQTMNNTYGYIRGTEGVDGDHIDIFLSDNPTEGNVYVVDQVNPDGSFDEHKVMYGFNSAEDARAAYLSNYEEGWQGLSTITEVSKDEFKKWLNSSRRKTKPFSEYKSVNAIGAQNEDNTSQIQGLQGYSRDKIKNIVKDYVGQKLSDADAKIKGVEIHGSRNRGDAREDSDLDVVIEYEGDIREDDMFNLLNDDEDALYIEDIRVDINPIREQETGTLDKYMDRSREYDEEKKNKEYLESISNKEKRAIAEGRTEYYIPVYDGWGGQRDGRFDKVWLLPEDVDKDGSDLTYRNLDLWSKEDAYHTEEGFSGVRKFFYNKEELNKAYFGKSKTEEKSEKPASQTDYEKIERDNFNKTYKKINDSIQGNIPNIPNIKKRIQELKKSIPILEKNMATSVSNDKEFDDAQRRIYALTGELKAWQKALKEINDKLKKSGETTLSDKAEAVEEKPVEEKKPEYGANNKVVSKERYEELKKRMIKKLGQLNFGMDPELIEIGVEMTAYHLEAGARKFADYAKAMINDVGDVIRPYLKSLYNAARDYPDVVEAGLNVGMSTGDEVSKFDVTNFDKKTIDALATADNVVKEQNIKKETEKIIKENEKKSEQTAKKSVSSQKIADLFGDINGSTKSDAQRRFSDTVKSDMLSALDRGEKPYRSIVDLRKRASEVGMDVDNEGRSDILLQELVEDGLVGAAREVVNKYGSDSKDSYDLICKLYDMQPTIAARSSNRIKMQQYSTPLPMAWNAAHFAMSGKQGGKVLEPTAGNGMLVFAVPANQVHANELDETRLNNLREQGFAEVTQQDATEPFEGGKQYDSIIANPPFGSREAVDYGGKMIPGLDPQITLNALSSMKDDGKAAIIIGGNMEYAKNGSIKSMKPFFTYLYDHYNVKGVVDMDGKLYAKQGTTFPTRMILIDGRRSEEERAQTTVYPPVESKAVAKVSSFEELYNTVNDIINSKEKTNGTEILHSREREPLSVNNRPSGDTEGNRRTEQPRKNDARGRGNKSEGSKNKSERVLPGEHRKNIGNGGVRSEATGSEPGRSRGNNEPDIQRVDGVGVSTDRVGLKEEPKKRTLTEEKLPYRPHNTAFSLNSVAPSAMVEAMDKILTQIEKENGNIDEFVRKELGYDTIEEAHQALAAEQMDSVAMAIYQMKKGQALIIGDQTGVGKGRQMAALIRWAVKRGEKPIFITQKADLFSDIYRDLVDVGSGDLVPFIFNSDGAMVDSNGNVVHKPLSASAMSKVFASGELPDSYDFAVLTYSQVNTGDAISQKEAEEAAKKSGTRAKKSKASKEGKPTPKATFLRAIAKDNYLFLDESHTAAGSSKTGAYLQSILKSAKAATFASATFAKRPDTMPLYAIRTAMSQAKIEPEKLISIIEKGGVTLQEIMSRELTNAGQMVRRERDMSDVKTDWKTIDDPSTVKRARENYDKTIQAFNAIIKFQNDFVKPKIDDLDQSLAIVAQSAGIKKGTDKMGVENVPFASKTYNYTKQLMLALKVDAIADEVEKEINAGRHPVIALESTMESTIKDYSAGEVIKEPTFSASLLKGLDSVMQYTIKDEDGKETHARYAPSDLGKAGEEAYYNLQKLIRESTSDIFISPLDAIIERLHEKGYKVGELTGRNLYVERNENGEVVVKRRTDKDKKKMQRDFNSGNLDVLILNKSASTGISLHASEKFKDQRQRTMIIAQPLSDINDYMQMIGRIDRTGQVHRGYYINLGLPVPAENRFLMMLSTKLKSLNANTTTSQDSKSNEVEAPDLLNKYGSQVVVEYLRDNPEVYEKMGAPLKKGGLGSGKVQASELDEYKPQDDDARKITGYVALLSTKEQEDFYNDVVKRYNDLIQYLNDTGSNDLKINVMPLRAKTLEKRVSSEGIDPNGTNPFAKNAYVEKVEMDVLRKPMKAEEVRKTIDKLNKTSVDVTTDVIRKESDAKIASENARYENAREKALDDIQKQKEKIEKSKKLSDEEKVAAINSYITDTNNTIEERHDKNLKKITDNRDQLIRRLRMFDAGKSYLVPDNLESMTFDFASPAIFCGYKAKENKITASTTLAVFATLDSRRRIEIKLSDINALQSIDKMTMDNIDAARAITIDNWDSQIPTETRKEGYILTGNILQAIADSQDEYGGYTGHLVSYTDIDGNIHDGILMPDKWNTSLLKSSGAPLSARMEQIKRYEPIVSSDGKVTLNGSQWAEMYYLTVPKTKKDGAMYYENKVLLDASNGEFYPYRGNLRVDIPSQNIEGVVKELTKLGVKVREINDVVQRNDLYRQGTGALTDSELSNANDPAGKMLGKPSRTPAQQKAFAERERQRMADRAREVADILHLDNVEIVTDASTLQGRRAKAKGFYSRDNGKIVIVVPNHVDMADIEQTVLHEAVAHYGLRKLFGSNFDTFLYNVYNNADMDVREKISQLAAQHNWNFATATEEYLASLAEKTNFENLNASWWDKIKSLFLKLLHSIGLKGFTGVSLSDNELRYILWRSYENLKNPGRYRSIIDEAKDITMQNELRVGNYSAGNSEAVGKAAENGVVNIEDVNRRFNEELGRLTEENAQSVILNLGRPGNFLLASGLSDRPIKLYGNKLLKKMRKHGFTTSDVKNLPKEINNPIAVFKGSVENSFAILTELEINGNNVLASISVGKGNDIDFNIISSVYGKNGNSVVSWINDGKILYVNKEKALNYLRISAPIAEAQDNQELSSAANIVKNFENPNISEENMRYGNGALAASESNGINKTNETNGQEAEEANRRFNEELNAFKAKTHKGLLHLGQPGRILNACGINEELTLSPTVLSRKLKQHGLNVDDIKGLAGAIQEPILVYQHGDAHPNMVIVTDLAAKGGKVSVAVELDGEGNVVELNNVSSVHSKGATTELERLSNMRDGYLEQALRWVDKNKVSDWLGIADLNSPIHANNPKLVSIANILQNFENPSVGEENILYREAKKVEKKINSDWRDEYDKKLSKFSFKLTEAAQDAMRSVKILQDIIAKETSAPIRDDENVYWRENRLSSVNKYEQEYYNENYCKPIVTEIANLVKYGARYNDKGEDIINSDNDVLKYLIAKSGLERNQSKREVEAMNARKPYEDQIKELQKQVEKEEIKEENAKKKIAKLQEQADKAEMNKRVAVLHKDYSGLTELFQDEKDFDTLATSYVSDFEKKFDTESLWNAINRATKETLRKAFVDGLISRESYESTAKMYKYYIPLRGWANDVASEAYNYKGSGEGSRKILQTAKGRTSLADNPISEIGRMMQDAIFQGNRNRMKQAVYNLAMNHDTSLLNIKRQWYQNMGTEEDPAWERVFPDLNSDMTAEQVAEEVEEFESRMRELKKEGRATQSRKGLILRLHTTKREEAQHRISVAINGKEYNIFVNGNPRAAQAINGELNDVDRYGSAVAKVNRFLSQVYTSINPEFVVTNYQRDAGFAASIVASTEPWSYQKEWAKNMTVYNPITTGVYLNRLIKKAKTGNINPSNKAERYMQEFLSHGGETGFTNMLSADDYKKQIKRDIKSINSVVSLSKASRAAVAFTERANTVFEDATRYATYVTSREQGRTIDRSIRDAKEISLNFNTRGADGLPGDGFIYRFFRGLRRWMIFVNPSIQGLNKAGMAFRNHPLRSSMMIAGLPTLLGYALPAIMRAVVGGGDGDDDDKNVVESYKDLPKWVRRTNIAIPIGGNNFVTIPLSYELRVSYGLGEMMWEYGEGMIDKDEVATETLSQLSDLLPISFSNGTVAQSISPSIARPLIDVIQNRNFYGKKIYNDSQFIEGYPEYMKAYAGTHKWLVKSTEVLNNVIPNLNAGVSDKYTPGAINVNPAIIDYLLSSYLGGLYNFPSKFGKTISMIWDEDMRDIQNVPIVSRNWKNSQSGNPYNSGDRYKTYMKEYDLSKQRFNGYKKEAEHDVPEFLKSLNDLLDTPSGKRMLMIDAYKRDGLDKLNRRIRDIDTYGNEKYEGEKDALTKRRDGLKEELINKLDSISDGTLDFVNGEWTRK